MTVGTEFNIRRDRSPDNTGNTAANPVTNTLNGGQTGSTFSGLITCSNCSVNGYEFGQPGVPHPLAATRSFQSFQSGPSG